MYAAVNKINLYYKKNGYNSDTIIFLHGNGEDHTIFDKLALKFKDEYRLIQVDSRSHGQSDTVGNLSYYDMAQDIYELIKTLNLRRVIIIGYSDGANTALLLASKYPFLIKKLVLCSPNSCLEGLKKTEIIKMKASYLLNRSDKLRLMLQQEEVTKEQLNKISCPTLILGGSNDLIKQDHFKYLNKEIIKSLLKIYKNKDHYDYLINSDFIYKDVDYFLRKNILL
ncbi:alpha/beta fold hydrolase [Mycoplasma sp. P36-A1]|uniref:alpha/beta fold hydrolase n=1 Tax=Mycoplasma sp. P36-A1 TaxID=3252900 RepID=UPI003C2E4B23